MKKRHILVSFILVLGSFLGGCGQEALTSLDPGDSPQLPAPITISLEGGDWGYPTPYAHYFRGPGAYKMTMIFDSMLECGEEGLIPWLAQDWDISPDGTHYTFHIRQGVMWQDGTPMTAEDIIFSFNYYKDHPPVRDHLALASHNYIEAMDLIDAHTISIRVTAPDATLLERFGMARILPKHIWETVDDPKQFMGPEAVMGCGPYKLTDYNKEQGAYKLEAYEDYWGPRPMAQLVQFVPVSDPILAFENGDIDLTGVTPDLLPKYKDQPDYKVIENPAFWGYRILFNMERRPELQDRDLRLAIAHSIDQEELMDKVARGAAQVASPGYLPLEHPLYNDQVKPYPFNLDEAKRLLAGETYEFSLLIGNSNPEVRIGELLKLNFEKVGISLKVISLDGKSRDAAIESGDYDLVLYGHGGWGNDPDSLRQEYHSDFSKIIGYVNPEIDHLAQAQLTALDPDTRKDIIFDLQVLIAQDLPQLPLYNTSTYTVYHPDKYDGWQHVFNHHEVTHNKISYLEMD